MNARERARLPPLRLMPRALARVTPSHGEMARFDPEVGYAGSLSGESTSTTG